MRQAHNILFDIHVFSVPKILGLIRLYERSAVKYVSCKSTKNWTNGKISTLYIEGAGSSETSPTIDKNIRCYNVEG